MISRIIRSISFRTLHAFRQLRRWTQLSTRIGSYCAYRYLKNESPSLTSGQGSFRLRPKGIAHPILIRPNSTDLYVFEQIFIQQEYSSLVGDIKSGTIIDCGANIGLSAIFFLNLSSNIKIISIEPDKENAKQLRDNLAPYGDRATVLEAAVWSSTTTLYFTSLAYRGGGEWARQVTANPENAATTSCDAISLGEIRLNYSIDEIELLKVDIEGAEGELFSNNTSSWLPSVRAIAIELHQDTDFGDCETTFHKAVTNDEFHKESCGELIICRRRENS